MTGRSGSSPTLVAHHLTRCDGRPHRRDPDCIDFFETVASRIVADFAPTTVLDAGCGLGLLVEALRRHGVQAWGIDISESAIGQVAPVVRPYCEVRSVTEPLQRRYDLIVTTDVLGQLARRDADRAIANLAGHSDRVIFSSPPVDQRIVHRESTYLAEGWAEAFARAGLYREFDYDASYISPWAVGYRRDTLTTSALVRRYERWASAREQAVREAQVRANELLRVLAGAETRLERLAWLEKRSAEMVQELQARTLERDDAAFDRQRTLDQLAHAHATIRAMESSLFWRARRPWAALSRVIRGK